MSRILIAPSRYVQGEGAINEIGVNAARLGTKALFTGGKEPYRVSALQLRQALAQRKSDVTGNTSTANARPTRSTGWWRLREVQDAILLSARAGGR